MAKTSTRPIPPTEKPFCPFAILAGIFLALVFLKFGNPIIFEDKSVAPTDFLEFIYQPWPFHWGYIFLALLAATGLKTGHWKIHFCRTAAFGLLIPLIWLMWQFISAAQTVDANLTKSTLKHFTACLACFYIGWFYLGNVRSFRPLFIGILIGFGSVIVIGWQQHFGGLEQTRRFFYELPNWREYPPEFLKKVSSNRIYSTLFYPNTLAAAILLMLPISLVGLWSLTSRWSLAARYLFVGLFASGAIGCLFWSGSKSGWLLALLLAYLSLLRISFSPRLKSGLVIGLLMVGLSGFAIKYAGFFQRGATSVTARFDYWQAAVKITERHPLLGTGPGTFFIPYQKIKKTGAEMARLTHNDYLEQASDSGLVGFLSFTIFVFGSLIICRPRRGLEQPILFSIWLGLIGVSLHSLVEFNLYIPAIAWPTFLFFGWIWRQRVKEIFDKNHLAS